MYTLHKAYAHNGSGWAVASLGALTIEQAAKRYTKAQLFILDNQGNKHQLDLHTVYHRLDVVNRGWTITAWLQQQPEGSLVSHTPIRELSDAATVDIRPLWAYSCEATLGNRDFGVDTPVPTAYRTDIALKRLPTTPSLPTPLPAQAFYTVNGRLMATQEVNQRIFLANAKRFMDPVGGNIESISVVDFSDLGSTQWLGLTEDNLRLIARNDVDRGQDQVRVRVHTEVPLTDQFVLPVIEGIPVFGQGACAVYDVNTLVLTLHLPTVHNLLADTPHEWWAGVKEEGAGKRATVIETDHLDLVKWLSAGFSGLILVDNPDISLYRRPAGRTDIPGLFTYPYPPKGFMVSDSGRLVDYTIHGYDGERASLNTLLGFERLRFNDSVSASQLPVLSYSAHRSPTPRVEQATIITPYSLKA